MQSASVPPLATPNFRTSVLIKDYHAVRGWHADEFGHAAAPQTAYFQAEIARAGAGTGAGADFRVLDIGFGNGTFMGWCRHKGWACGGTELNVELVRRARAAGFEAWNSIDDIPVTIRAAGFDLIAAFDVLEHIERAELIGFLVSIRSLCHSRSSVLLRFPNGDNPFALPIQNGDVTHVNSIGRSMLRQVAELAGFSVVSISDPVLPVAGASPGRRLAIAVGAPVRRAIGSAIRHLFMGGMDVSFAANLVVVLKPVAV